MSELNKIAIKIKNAAPTLSISNSMRRYIGQPSDEYSTAGYKCICVYVQHGLSGFTELFREIAKAIFRIQVEAEHTYHLLVFGFGVTGQLMPVDKAMSFLGRGNLVFSSKIANTIASAAGDVPETPAVIGELYPVQRVKGLGYGKSKIENDDLLIIIGRKNEFALSYSLKAKISSKLRKQIFFVEIDADDVNYYFKDTDYFNRFVGLPTISEGEVIE